MFYQHLLAAFVTSLAIHLALAVAENDRNSLTDAAGELCHGDAEALKLCHLCDLSGVGVDESTCCADVDAFERCRGSVRRKRDAAAGDDRLLSALVGPKMASRARPFLGKRTPYGNKRPRNNFLGKRDGGYGAGIPLVDLMEQDDDYKRARPFLGKKARPFLGKRSELYPDRLADEGGEDKRARPFLGKRSELYLDRLADEGGEDKRARPFLGKRARRPFLGKRMRRPFLGKRDFDDADGVFDERDGLVDEEAEEEAKRARPFLGKRGNRPFLGKRGRSRPFLGKRDEEEAFYGADDDDFNDDDD